MSVFGALLWAVCVKKVLSFCFFDQIVDIKKSLISLFVVVVTIFMLNIPEQSYLRFAIVLLAIAEYLFVNTLLRNAELKELTKRARAFITNHN